MYLILLVIPILALLIIIGLLLLIFKKWKTGILLLFIAFVLNEYTEQIPISPLSLSQNEGNGETITILGYNIHASGEGFEEKAKAFESLILKEKPDLVYLTEYYENNSSALDEKLKNHFTNTYLEWGNGERLYTNWRIVGVRHLKVEKQDEFSDEVKAAINTSWIYRFVLVKDTIGQKNNIFDSLHKEYIDTTYSHIDDPKAVDIDSLIVYTCHLETNNYGATRDSIQEKGWRLAKYINKFLDVTQRGYEIRKLETDCLYESIKKETCKKIIIIGDMNDINGSYTINKLEDTGLHDAWWEGGFGYGCTFHSYHLYLRLDHILFSNELKLKKVKVVDSDLSDHNALISTFE